MRHLSTQGDGNHFLYVGRLEQAVEVNGIPCRIVLGGLRPGGGEAWNEEFKGFLKHHWEEVTARSGQPFGDKLFSLDHFNYDTEPACRAVVVARGMKPEVLTPYSTRFTNPSNSA